MTVRKIEKTYPSDLCEDVIPPEHKVVHTRSQWKRHS